MRMSEPIVDVLFLATVFCVTFEKVHWNVAGTVSLADVLAFGFLVAFALERLGAATGGCPRTSAVVALASLAFLLVYLIGFFNLDTADRRRPVRRRGCSSSAIHILFLLAGVSYLARRSERFYWRTIGIFTPGSSSTRPTGCCSSSPRRTGGNLDNAVLSPLTGGASSINIYGAVEGRASTGRTPSRATRTTSGSC